MLTSYLGAPHDGDGARGGVGVGGVALTWKEMENDDDREFTRFGRLSVEGGREGGLEKFQKLRHLTAKSKAARKEEDVLEVGVTRRMADGLISGGLH